MDTLQIIVLVAIGLVVVLGTPVAAFAAFTGLREVRAELGRMRQRLVMVEAQLAQLQGTGATPPAPAPVGATAGAKVALPPPAPPPPPAPTPPNPPRRSLEQALSERWLVWLGGVTLALGGAFLVKYSVEQGLLGPSVRVGLGVLLGVAIIALGHRLPARMAGLAPSHVPAALVGAGISMVFASLYAAYALYGLMLAPTAFAALTLVAVAAALLSLRHGPFVALLGLLGGFVVPALVRSDHPSALALFAYLLALTTGSVVLLRWKQWWWLAWVSLAGCMGWTLAWLAAPFQPGDEAVVGVFLLAVFGLFAAFRLGVAAIPALAGRAEAPIVGNVLLAASFTVAALAFWLVRAADNSTISVVVLFALDLAMVAFARRDQEFDALAALAGGLSLLVLAGWDLSFARQLPYPGMFGPPLPQDVRFFAATAVGIAGLFGLGGFAAMFDLRGFVLMRNAIRPGRWAALSAALPVLVTAIAYWRLSAIGIDAAWSGGTLVLAVILLAAGQRVARIRSADGMEAALGAYAVGVIGALALAATIALEEAWLTVALALTLPGIAWVHLRLRVLGLRQTAAVVAGIVLVRLVLNPYALDYGLGDGVVFNWLLYGYGVPAVCFAGASVLFRRERDDLATQLLEAGAILFTALLASLEIHHAMGAGQAWGTHYSLAERALHTDVWLVMAAALFHLHRRSGRAIPGYAAWILLGLATFQAVVLQAWSGNPVLTNDDVGAAPLFNLLLPAFFLPALLYGVHAALGPLASARRQWSGRLGLTFALLWLSLEVRHAFAGSRLAGALTGDSELYAYSLAWLAYAAAALAAGMRWGLAPLRRWGLGALLLVVAKVFLVDMSQLAGIWRALSFLGLGGALIAVGWLYRRCVRVPAEP